MSDLERLVLEKHRLLQIVAQRDAIICALIGDGTTLKTTDIHIGASPRFVETKTLLKILPPEDKD